MQKSVKAESELRQDTMDEPSRCDAPDCPESGSGSASAAPVFPSVSKPWLKYYDPEVVDSPLPHLTMYGYLKHTCELHGALDKEALFFEGFRQTFRELFRSIDECAAAFQACGVKRGDFVTILSVSVPETYYAVYGLNKIGAVCNFVDVRTDPEHTREFIKKAKSTVLVALEMSYGMVADHLDDLGLRLVICQNPVSSLSFLKRLVIRFKAPSFDVPYDGTRIVKMTDFLKRGRGRSCEEVPYEPSAAAAITRTGGTTGVSKGVVLTNDSMNAVAKGFNDAFYEHLTKNGTLLNFLPVGVSYGLAVGMHSALCVSLRSVLIPKFDLQSFDEYVLKYRPNFIVAVPSFYDVLASSKKLDGVDLSFVDTMASGGDSINEGMEERLERFRVSHNMRYPVAGGYGLSEVSSATAYSFRSVMKSGSAGVPALGSIVSVFKPGTCEELPAGQQGEICVTGFNVMKEYLDEPEETANVMRVHPDGLTWVHTGDIGYMDEDGFLFVVGRIKRAIVRYDGHKMYPLQIEDVVMSNENVEHCVVVGVPDRDNGSGHMPLVVVEKKDTGIDDDELRAQLFAACRERIEKRSQPVAVEFVDSIPLTDMFKVNYKVMEERFADYDYRTA